MLNAKLGIPSTGFEYQRVSREKDRPKEFEKSIRFLNGIFNKKIGAIAPELYGKKMSIDFINYGDTQMVYVFSSDNRRYAVLLGQPATQFGEVKEEFDNLNKLAQQNPNLVVKPNYYFCNKDRELYIAPYHFQARCVASQENGWGVYIPEPYYRFELFTEEERHLVNTCIIANLISLYNEKENLGLASCKIGGGDFILEKEPRPQIKTIDSTLARMKLIAARKLISVSFDEYVELLRREFLLSTYYRNKEDQDLSILINQKSRVPMENDDIERGIQLGLKLKQK